MEIENKVYCALCSLSATCVFSLCFDQQSVRKPNLHNLKKRKYTVHFFPLLMDTE